MSWVVLGVRFGVSGSSDDCPSPILQAMATRGPPSHIMDWNDELDDFQWFLDPAPVVLNHVHNDYQWLQYDAPVLLDGCLSIPWICRAIDACLADHRDLLRLGRASRGVIWLVPMQNIRASHDTYVSIVAEYSGRAYLHGGEPHARAILERLLGYSPRSNGSPTRSSFRSRSRSQSSSPSSPAFARS